MAKIFRWRSYSQPVWVGFFSSLNHLHRLSNYLPSPFSASATPGEMNARHLILEIIWFGLALGSTLTFQVVYATRLGATPLQISLLTAGPALVNMLLTLPIGRWLAGRALVPTVFWTSVAHRLSLLLLVFLPLLMRPTVEIWLLIGITLLAAVPQAALMISFTNLFAELVPNVQRMRLVSIRNAMLALSATTATAACGQLLDRLTFPLNYQVVFFIGLLGAVISSYHLSRLHSSARSGEKQAVSQSTQPQLTIRRRYLPRISREGLRRLRQNTGTFLPFLGAIGLFHLGQFAIAPILTLYWVRVAFLSDSQIGVLNAGFFITNFLAALAITRWLDRLGPRRSFLWGAGGMVFYAVFTGFSTSFIPLLLTQVWGGIIWVAATAGSYNRLLELCPVENRATHLAAYNFVLNGGMLLGPLIASQVVDATSLTTAMFVGAGLRLLGFLALLRWG